MKKPNKEEALRWFTQTKDEFIDADDLRKRERFYLALFHFQSLWCQIFLSSSFFLFLLVSHI